MLAIVLALASAVGYGGSDFAAGLASRSAPVIQITLLASVVSGVIVAAALPFAASPGPNGAALAWGFVGGTPVVRYGALALFGLTVVKVFLVDLAAVSTVYRVVSFLVLGVVLLGVSALYQKARRA